MSKIPLINPNKKFSDIEKEILSFWKENNIFQKSVNSRPEDNEYVFFDGPPFATGTPHYGHILAGAIKDAIPRYKTMQGYRVNRKFGWDCHGVPVEFLIEKEHKIGGKPGIEKMGVSKFNELCESAVMRCRNEWESTVERMGRFVDFKNDYKTMDPDYMESVWSVFKALWDKGLIYEGEKVVAYSPRLGSPLSNFEANQNYKNIKDKTLIVKFELKEEKNTYLLAWTTTPWTLPSNLALCLHPNLDYSFVKKSDEIFIIASSLVEKNFSNDIEVIKQVKGKDLVGKKYKPLFSYYKNHQNAFQVLADDFVSAESGTGIVHLAPNFGEDDSKVCLVNDINFLEQPIDENGYFTDKTTDLKGKYFRFDEVIEGSKENNANDSIIRILKEENKVFKQDQYDHEYPFCWRTDCALMYRGIRTWFVNVQKIKNLMLAENQKINWNPEHLKDGRFGKILENAPDWAISRNRYWGAPLPVWRCESCGNIEVISTRKELEDKTGKKVNDIHKQHVDKLTWGCKKCSGKMIRVPEVLDCWFESGAMPYASREIHFQALENKNVELIVKTPETSYEINEYNEIAKNEVFEFYNSNLEYNPNHEDQLREDSIKKIFLFKGDIVGMAFLYPKNERRVFMGVFGIKKDLQHKGYGKLALKELEKILINDGFEEIVFNASDKVLPFYQKNGYIENFWTPNVQPQSNTIPYGKKLNKSFSTDIYFVRHGESKKNFPVQIESCTMESSLKYPLTEKGVADAIIEAENYENIFDVIVTSPFLRAKQTAEIFQKYSPKSKFVEDVRLVDINVGKWDDKKLEDSNLYRKNILKNDPTKKFEGGESLYDVQDRMIAAYNEIQEKYYGKKVLIVSHGCPLEVMKDSVEGKQISYWEKCLANSKVFKLENITKIAQADFIAEGLDQTRGWFYTLHVLGCALVGKNIYKNVITNGIVLAEDGQKMSKSKQNYPDPSLIFDKYGADSMRYYMLSSPVVRAENFKFAEKGVEEVMKKILLPLHNVYSFFSTYANIDNWFTDKYIISDDLDPKMNLDKWILSEYEFLREEYSEKFELYKLDEALRLIPNFIDSLTNWYIRRSRDRFWESGLSEEKTSGYKTLFFILTNISKILAPVCPFYADFLWINLNKNIKNSLESVHLSSLAEPVKQFKDTKLSNEISLLRDIISLSAKIRARKKIKNKQPLSNLSFAISGNIDLSKESLNILKEEVNVKNVELLESLEGIATKIVKPNARLIGKRLGKKTQEIIKNGKIGNFELLENKQIKILDEILTENEYEIAFECNDGIEGEGNNEAIALLNTEISEDLYLEGIAREIIRHIQESRKQSGFNIADRISVKWYTESKILKKAYESFEEKIDSETLTLKRLFTKNISKNALEIDGEKIFFMLQNQ